MEKEPANRAAWTVVVVMIVGYIGVYLCRKNLSVAVPLLQDAFGVNKETVGQIATVSTIAYACGKLVNGVVVDRIGGRMGFLLALTAVALFGAAGAFAPSVGLLTLCYSLNRFAGSAGWGSMLKLMPTWFRPARMATAIAILSLSYVFGGAAATLLATAVARLGGDWRAVMGVPSVVLLVLTVLCLLLVRRGPLNPEPAPRTAEEAARSPEPVDTVSRWSAVASLLVSPQFLLVCALSFTLTLMRESFNTWSVDFLASVQGGAKAVALAGLQSTGFDLAGAVSIVGMGWVYDRVWPGARHWLIAGILGALAAVVAVLPGVGAANPLAGAWLVALVGLLVYGPYSLLGGVMAVESGGARMAATAAGIIDSCGYLAGILAGRYLGRLLDQGGYSLGFRWLAAVTAISAVLALGLRPRMAPVEAHEPVGPPSEPQPVTAPPAAEAGERSA
jgi:MFS transporter, OPA family, glycerol-3-phosphate transporter